MSRPLLVNEASSKIPLRLRKHWAWFKYGVLPFVIIFLMGLAHAHMTFNLETFFRVHFMLSGNAFSGYGREAPLVMAFLWGGLTLFVVLGVWLRFLWAAKVGEARNSASVRKTLAWGALMVIVALSWSYRGNGIYTGWLAWWADDSLTLGSYLRELSHYFWFLPVVLAVAGLYWVRPVAGGREVRAS